mmetsp:Transcript_111565/g.315891  ORF Transcript_111565/g.315891 Transcript_111565/m.315891 type:complete len:225 (-) Transcript_111565:120-794(-)
MSNSSSSSKISCLFLTFIGGGSFTLGVSPWMPPGRQSVDMRSSLCEESSVRLSPMTISCLGGPILCGDGPPPPAGDTPALGETMDCWYRWLSKRLRCSASFAASSCCCFDSAGFGLGLNSVSTASGASCPLAAEFFCWACVCLPSQMISISDSTSASNSWTLDWSPRCPPLCGLTARSDMLWGTSVFVAHVLAMGSSSASPLPFSTTDPFTLAPHPMLLDFPRL